jgi:hypothetical protein
MGSLQKLQQFGKGPENAAELLGKRNSSVSLARPWENGKSGRIKNRTAKAEAKQTRHKVHLSASLCKFGKRV